MGCVSSQDESANKFKAICDQHHISFKAFKSQISFLKQQGYHLHSIIGTSFGDVVIHAFNNKKQPLAIKIINYENVTVLDQESKGELSQYELNAYTVNTYEYLINKQLKSIFAVRELCDCSLRDFITANVLTQKQVYALTKQLLEGIVSLQDDFKNAPINTNIKPENILYSTYKNTFLFADLDAPICVKSASQKGFTRIQYTTLKHTENNLYSSPEISSELPNFTNKADMFSLGQCLAEILRGKKFLSYQQQNIRDHNSLKRFLSVDTNTTFELYIKEILLSMINVNLEERLEPKALLQKFNQLFPISENDMQSFRNITIPPLAIDLSHPKQKLKEVSVTKDNHRKLGRGDHNVHINLSMSNYNDEFLDSVSESLSNCHDVIRLYINCFANDEITDAGFMHLIQVTNRFAHLQRLKLEFPSCEKIKGSEFNLIAIGLKSFKNLQHITLKFDECSQLKEDALISLSEGLKNSQNLQKLQLSFSQCYNISNEGITKLSEGIIACKNKLKVVALNFHKCYKIKDVGFIALANALKQIKNLIKLSLIFSSTSISNDGVTLIKDILLIQKNLEQFDLNIKETNVTEDDIIIQLFEASKKCIDLEEIKLNFEKIPFQNIRVMRQIINDYYQQNKYMQYELLI